MSPQSQTTFRPSGRSADKMDNLSTVTGNCYHDHKTFKPGAYYPCSWPMNMVDVFDTREHG